MLHQLPRNAETSPGTSTKVQYREFYDAAIVECMKLPLSLSVVDMATMRVAEGASERIGAELRTTMFERAMTRSLRWHDPMRSGELVSRLNTDVGRVQDRVVALATSFPPDAVMLVAVLALLFVFDPGLLLIGLTVIPLLAALAVRQRTRIRDDTSLGESGVRLSGGQRRRVAIARAAVSKAPMVLLDEPTASLDPRSAAAVIEAIRTATTNRTVLVVTHDRDLAAIADRVVTLAGPVSRGEPGVQDSTELQQDGRR
jgi:ABC-type multidrug transport system fused ATPase/permease subunit